MIKEIISQALGSVLAKIIFLIGGVLVYLQISGAINFIDWLEQPIPFWVTLLLILAGIAIQQIYKKFLKKQPSFHIAAISRRDITEKEINFEYKGVKWIAYVPGGGMISGGGEYVRVLGPYCPDCIRELKENKPFLRDVCWVCPECNKKYLRSLNRTKIKEDVEDWLFTEVYRKHKFQ